MQRSAACMHAFLMYTLLYSNKIIFFHDSHIDNHLLPKQLAVLYALILVYWKPAVTVLLAVTVTDRWVISHSCWEVGYLSQLLTVGSSVTAADRLVFRHSYRQFDHMIDCLSQSMTLVTVGNSWIIFQCDNLWQLLKVLSSMTGADSLFICYRYWQLV
jgi:hypothetical protein